MDYSSIVGFALPTCYPDRALSKFFSDESLMWLDPLKDILTILINFQPTWNEESINKALSQLNKYNLKYEYVFNTYKIEKKGHIPFMKIRNDCSLIKDCEFYVLIDDDFVFSGPRNGYNNRSSGQQYVDAIYYMIKNNKCGLVQMRNRAKKIDRYVPDNCIYPTPIISKWQTDCGIVIRSLKNHTDSGNLFPNDSEWVMGAGEERLLAGYVLSQGLFPARMSHCNVKNNPPENLLGWGARSIELANVTKYIREHYNPDHDNALGNPISEDLYIKNGGIMYTDDLCKELGIDFSSMDTNEELLFIKSYFDNLNNKED